MKRIDYTKLYALLVLSATCMTQVNAQTNPTAVITTAAPSLRTATDARAGGMGNVGIATDADAGTLFFNQAKAPFGKQTSAIGVNYAPWMREVANDMYALHLSGYHRFDSMQAFTGSVRYFNLGDFKLKDLDGNILQTARPHEFSIDLGYARRLSEQFSIGVALRYINSSLASGTYGSTQYKAGEAVAGDVSLYYNGQNEQGQGLSAGLSLSNIGSKISYTENAAQKEFLPTNLGVGVAYTAVLNEDNKISFAADVNKLMVPEVPQTTEERDEYYKQGALSGLGKGFSNKAWQYGAGVEFAYKNMFMLRAGYMGESENQGNRKGLTVGAGIRYDVFAFNFSYLSPTGTQATRNPQSNTLRFGLQVGF
jgi:opacity protein-like surface antigen